MAEIQVLTDDLEAAKGKHVAGTDENPVTRLSWGFDGTAYIIDLSDKNRLAFETAIKPYLAASTEYLPAGTKPVSKSAGRKSSGGSKLAKSHAEDVREWLAAGKGKPAKWAGDKGEVSGHVISIDGKSYQVGPRGRVPEPVWKLWEKETGSTYTINGSEPASDGSAVTPAGQGTEPATAS